MVVVKDCLVTKILLLPCHVSTPEGCKFDVTLSRVTDVIRIVLILVV
jgi:hypothetical protein